MSAEGIVEAVATLGISTGCLIVLGRWVAGFLERVHTDWRKELESWKQQVSDNHIREVAMREMVAGLQEQNRHLSERCEALQTNLDQVHTGLTSLEAMIRDRFTKQIDENNRIMSEVAIALREVTQALRGVRHVQVQNDETQSTDGT